MFFFWGMQELATNTTEQALNPGGNWDNPAGNKTTHFYTMASGGVLKNFFIRSRTTGAGAGTVTARVWVNAGPAYSGFVDTGINITVSQNSNLEGQNTADTYSVSKGDRVAVTMQQSVAGTTLWEEPSATLELLE